ncbi:hypothetical protein [Solirubrobacter pauli]|uniref:hypothetical protein n=1 Tax=Solirubrobacter pauli TaxID=166793 RepID=UPI0011C3A716|nr:hypothetical protein [Solirubrobacter pauli]
MSSQGHPYTRFRRSLEIGQLPMVLAAAAELPRLGLDDALEVLALMAGESTPERYAAAAARWCGRLVVERGTSLAELELAVAACKLLPQHPAGIRVLRELCGRPLQQARVGTRQAGRTSAN